MLGTGFIGLVLCITTLAKLQENLILLYANYRGTDRPVHLCSLISMCVYLLPLKDYGCRWHSKSFYFNYSKTCVKRPLKIDKTKNLNDKW